MFTYCKIVLTNMAPATKKKKSTGVSRSYMVLRKSTLDPKISFRAREHHVQPPRPVHTWQQAWLSSDARDYPEYTCIARSEYSRILSGTRKTKTVRPRPLPRRFVPCRRNTRKHLPPKKPPRRRRGRPRSVGPQRVGPRWPARSTF